MCLRTLGVCGWMGGWVTLADVFEDTGCGWVGGWVTLADVFEDTGCVWVGGIS